MLSITKLQNLKAIHNVISGQFGINIVVINHKTTKFESNSQRELSVELNSISCYQSQNYKIWKQFTTKRRAIHTCCQLLSITKLQNLKAIHNKWAWGVVGNAVVINHKTTKFESNSQLSSSVEVKMCRCYQSQNYKIWKQFTTEFNIRFRPTKLLSITKLQNLKAIHNRWGCCKRKLIVVINHKTTKFESNSQQNPRVFPHFPLLLSITKLQNLKAIHN